MQRDSKVYVLLLNWRGWQDTIECLESVFRQEHARYQVVVCDNDSGNGSLEQIAAWARGEVEAPLPAGPPLRRFCSPAVPKPIRYVELTREEAEMGAGGDAPLVLVQTGGNLGYAGGNNVGLRYVLARGDAAYVWLLNNDTVIHPRALSAMVRTAEDDPGVGMVGSRLLYYDDPERIQAIAGGQVVPWSGFTRHLGADQTDLDRWSDVLEPDYITGASMLVRSRLLEQVGMLDERYFLYSEEVDWCLRSRAGGWKLVYAPGSTVWHKGGQSVQYKSPLHDYHVLRGMLLLVRRFYPGFLPVAVAYSVYRQLAPKVVRLQGARIRAVLRAYRDFFAGRDPAPARDPGVLPAGARDAPAARVPRERVA
ncbi:MAG TPA: glycosyltransferase family 2 protein [Longimicrobiaceae bacterium]|nr:glycosyltransferase family 2 protein [Longimicrobiaceae bacterium]